MTPATRDDLVARIEEVKRATADALRQRPARQEDDPAGLRMRLWDQR